MSKSIFNKLEVSNLEIGENHKNHEKFFPGIGTKEVNIQTISDESLKILFEDKYITSINIPLKKEIIGEEFQSEYFKKTKKQIEDRLFRGGKFVIVEGPTGTGKTTLIKTVAYENGLEIYSDIGDEDKTLNSFSEEVKSYINGESVQIKTIPGNLLKAMTGGGIYLINEANILQYDLQITLANLIENDFFIFDGKKYLIHDNFSLAFTSNPGYLGTKPYSNAVVRKAGGIVSLEHEESEESEILIIKNIYQKKSKEFTNGNKISDENLEKIVKNIVQFRKDIKDSSFYTGDGSDFGDHFYIRLYEKIIGKLLIEKIKKDFTLIEIIEECGPILKEAVQYKDGMGNFINFSNEIEKYREILKSFEERIFIEKKGGSEFGNLGEMFTLIASNNDIELEKGKNSNIKIEKSFNPINLSGFKKTIEKHTSSEGKKIKRKENVEKISRNFYESILSTKKDKKIEIIGEENNYLKIKLNGALVFLKNEGEEKFPIKEKELIEFISDNPNIFIYFEDENFGDEVLNFEGEEKFYTKINSIFSAEKSFDIRKRSKILRFEFEGEKYVIFLGFKGNVKDVRYEDEDGIFYIPQSKASDIIFSAYKESDKEVENKKGRFFTINPSGKIEIKKNEKNENDKILDKLKKDDDLFLKIKKEIFSRFRNADKLDLTNGGIEKSQTGIISPILISKDIQDKVWDSLGRKLEFSTKTTLKLIDDILDIKTMGYDLLLSGPSGVGKTSISKEIAKKLNLSYVSLQIDEDFSEVDIKSEVKWNEGMIENSMKPFLNFYKNGGVIELKELNYSLINVFLNEYMDQNGEIHFHGEVIKRHPDFFIIATMNPPNQTLFPGTKPINTALENRFMEKEVGYLPVSEQMEILNLTLERYGKNLKNDFPDFKEKMENIINEIGLPIIEEIERLVLTQEIGSTEILLEISKKILTIDILQNFIKTSKTKDELIGKIKTFFKFTKYNHESENSFDIIGDTIKKVEKL